MVEDFGKRKMPQDASQEDRAEGETFTLIHVEVEDKDDSLAILHGNDDGEDEVIDDIVVDAGVGDVEHDQGSID